MPRSYSSVEVLEARIAPALLINGANLLGGNGPSTGESSAGGNSLTVVKVLSGTAIVWYQDNHVVGISVGPNVNLEIHGDVEGDIVGNLTASGRLSDSDGDPLNGEDGAILLPNNIVGLKTFPLSSEKGDVGNIITGGSVTNVKILGSLTGLYAGDGVFDVDSHLVVNDTVTSSLSGLDVNPVEPGVQSTFAMTKTLAKTIDTGRKLTGMLPGAGISNVSIAKAVELQMFAGSGNPNELLNAKTVAGGSVRFITIESAFTESGGLSANAAPSYEIHAGAGSSGATGGAGGVIDHITEKTSTSRVVVKAGKGGDGVSGPGGAGGSITNFDGGSDSSRYFLNAGDGGQGLPGGAGGNVVGNNFANRSPIGGLLVTGNFDNDNANIDELIVINQGTGEMIVERNVQGDGTNFTPITQYVDSSTNPGTPVSVITSLGNTPVSAFATDVNNDGNLDVVIAYKNSNSLGIFLGQGNGSFWDPTLNNNAGGYDTISVALSFSPAKIAPSGGRIVVGENLADGTGSLHLLSKTIDTTGTLTFTAETGANPLTKPITDLVTVNDNSVIVATADGGLRRATLSGSATGKPFDISSSPLQTVAGGIIDLDVDATGTRIVALSTNANAFYTYDFSSASASAPLKPVSITGGLTGKPLVVHFVDDGVAGTPDQVAVLTGLTNNARVDVYSATQADGATVFGLSKSVPESAPLKNFVPVYGAGGEAGFAAVSGSLNQFTFSDNFAGGVDYALPFASKLVQATAGTGGMGVNFQPATGALKVGAGGAGGSVLSFNAEANEMIVTAGNGGNSQSGAGGAGGNIINPSITGTPATDTKPATPGVPLFLHADVLLSIKAGDGGMPLNPGKSTASGGAGGGLGNLNIEIGAGDLTLTSGIGGDSRGGAAGAGGNIAGITSVLHQGNLTVKAGHGGEAFLGAAPATGPATSGAGGAGGAVKGLKHELQLDPDVENFENPYFVKIEAGYGGNSVTAAGGAGGVIAGVVLKLDEPNITYDSGVDADGDGNDDDPRTITDSTLTTTLEAGAGGNGATGGHGGTISGLKYDVVLDQQTSDGILVGPAVLGLKGGLGGIGTNGAGGNGGGILLSSPISGLTGLDPDALALDPTAFGPTEGLGLLVRAGNAGPGSTKGGIGGDISGLTAQNQIFVDGSVIRTTMLFSAMLEAGDGGAGGVGDGGRGGNIASPLLGVQGGFLQLHAGDGGEGGKTGNATTAKLAKGGAGGAITGGEVGLVSSGLSVGMVIDGGTGGDGYAAGGVGGAITGLKLNASQSTAALSAVLYAGDGGAAKLATGVGGKGGDVTGVSQVKDVNSSINVIQAGNGGNNLLGKAGAGGNVSSIRTSGFIGRPSDGVNALGVLDTAFGATIAQGVFSGRGGTGVSAALSGVNGSVTGVTARQIAAIAAAMDMNTHLFAAASKVSGITADLIGYDLDRDKAYDNVVAGSTAAPDQVAPIDGFIFSSTKLVGVTGQRAGFVFAPL